MVRPKFDVISNYRGYDSTADSNVTVVCEGGGKEILATSFTANPSVYIHKTFESAMQIVKVNVRRITV